jgi:hypothetical protein
VETTFNDAKMKRERSRKILNFRCLNKKFFFLQMMNTSVGRKRKTDVTSEKDYGAT